jgi:hypothetical protein
MPLINFKTDFKTLRYGNDKPNGGSSTQPYIQSPIPDTVPNTSNAATSFFNSFYETNRTSLDFPIRGGKLSEVAGNTYTTTAGEIDRLRIQNFLKDAPRGPMFIQKQKGLQLTNPLTQVPSTIQNNVGILGLFQIDNQVSPVTQTYDPANTLAQIAAQGTGKHFNRHGISPTIYESPQTTYEYIVANSNTPDSNRLLLLSQLKLKETTGFLFGAEDAVKLQAVNQLGIASAQGQILNYQGGPGSTYGIGSTIIRRATSTIPAKAYSSIAFTYEKIANYDTRPGDDPLVVNIKDFRIELEGGDVASTVYPLFSQEARLNVGNPGINTFKRVNYNDIIPQAIDKLNAKNLFYYNANTQTPWIAGGNDTKDLIKFAFECMSNDYPGDAVALVFRAFLDGAIQDSNQAQYNSFKYLGRGETFRTYQGFDRSVSFNFKLFVQTRSEMRPLYKKLNHLISQVYPDYSPDTNFMRGNVVNLTIGDYFYRVPGFLENVNVTLNTDVGWEILLNGDPSNNYTETDVAQLPFVVDVSCTFKPIMNILPRRENYENPYIPLIADTGFLSTGIDNPDNSATNKGQALAAQIRAIEEATSQASIAAGDVRRSSIAAQQAAQSRTFSAPQLAAGSTQRILGAGTYAFNSKQPAPKKNTRKK